MHDHDDGCRVFSRFSLFGDGGTRTVYDVWDGLVTCAAKSASDVTGVGLLT